MLKNPFSPRLLKKVQMQGGVRCEVRAVLSPYVAAPRERANPPEADRWAFFSSLLRGDRKGSWAVRVSANWRVTFKFSGPDVEDVDYEDYH